MSMLKTLKLVAAKPAPSDTKTRNREKLIRYLADQKALVGAQLGGPTYSPTRMVTRKDEAGNRTRAEAPRHVRRGWFTDANGRLAFTVRYGAKPLELAKGMTAISVEKLEALPAVIDTLTQAVEAGELDAVAAAAAVERQRNFKGKPKA